MESEEEECPHVGVQPQPLGWVPEWECFHFNSVHRSGNHCTEQCNERMRNHCAK